MSVKRTKESQKGAGDVPQFFRLNIEVGDLPSAISFYSKLLCIEGRKQAGSRCYFECGPVTLQVVDVTQSHSPHAAAKALYFMVEDLEAVFERAQELKCVAHEGVHRAAVSWFVRGVSGRFTWTTPGIIPCASWRKGRCTGVKF